MKRLATVAAFIGILAATTRVLHVQDLNQAHFHHVHVNSTDPSKMIQFYEQIFGAQRINYKNVSDGLFTGRSFILIDKAASAPRDLVETIANRPGHNLRSFFIQGPDNVLIEIVEAKPLPDVLWQ